MTEGTKIFLGSVVVVWVALQMLARRRPDIAWLQRLRLPEPSADQRRRAERRSNTDAALHFILMGIALPLGYGALTVMTFGSFDPVWTTGVLVGSAACIGIGVFAIYRNMSS